MMRRLIAALALSVAAASPAMAEVVQAGAGSFVLRHAATVAAPQDEVWKMLLRPADWWSSDHTFSGDAGNLWLDGQATGCFCEKLPRPADLPEGMRSGSVEHLRVIYVEPPRALRMTGGLGPLQSEPVNAVMTVSLRSGAGRTRIALEYVASGLVRRTAEEMASLVDKVLGEQMARLAGKFPPVEAPASGTGEGEAGAAVAPAEVPADTGSPSPDEVASGSRGEPPAGDPAEGR